MRVTTAATTSSVAAGGSEPAVFGQLRPRNEMSTPSPNTHSETLARFGHVDHGSWCAPAAKTMSVFVDYRGAWIVDCRSASATGLVFESGATTGSTSRRVARARWL